MCSGMSLLAMSGSGKPETVTVYVGKLMVHPSFRRHGYGTMILKEIERLFPDKRYELFTSVRSISNIRFCENLVTELLPGELWVTILCRHLWKRICAAEHFDIERKF